MITTEQIKQWFADDKAYKFYKSKDWLRLRAQIMAEHHGECQWCREHGIITRAETVHHIQYVDKHPELALSRTYIDKDGKTKQNLVPLCHDCHDRAHHRMRYQDREKKNEPPLNEERW